MLRRRSKWGIHVICRLLVWCGAVLSMLPLVFLVCGTFMGEAELYQMLEPVVRESDGYVRWHFLPLYPTLQHVIELLLDTPEYYVLFWNSIKIVVVILIGQLLFATPAAYVTSHCIFKLFLFSP